MVDDRLRVARVHHDYSAVANGMKAKEGACPLVEKVGVLLYSGLVAR
jgi:hypothetical protein